MEGATRFKNALFSLRPKTTLGEQPEPVWAETVPPLAKADVTYLKFNIYKYLYKNTFLTNWSTSVTEFLSSVAVV